ncbi:MAG: DNA damage-inducible protein D [Candidatus Taylorbacteria bacterium]|nr:DNA damage-inducible protein D [Candidatus Taylorbacteria bacterium]
MSKNLPAINKTFESIKRVDENGIEFWSARELMSVLSYTEWRNFNLVIDKAKKACGVSLQNINDHFVDINKMIKLAKDAVREVEDYKLSRYACYLIAQNGDSSKVEIATAQTYFAVQTRKQEIFQSLDEVQKRIFIRNEVAFHNKKLFSTAKKAGINNFGKFNDAGYRGLYDMSLANIEKKKKIKKGELLDRAGSPELAANLFRITQTDEKIKTDKVRGQEKSEKTHHSVGRKVRKAIKDIGGEMPENLPIEKNIKNLKKEAKRLK